MDLCECVADSSVFFSFYISISFIFGTSGILRVVFLGTISVYFSL